MLAIGGGRAQYPVVVVEVDGVRCSALLNIEAGSSDASAALIRKLNRKPDRRKYKRIKMIITWTSQKIEMYKVQVSTIERVLSLPITQSKMDMGTFLTILNPMWISAPSTNSSRAWRLMTRHQAQISFTRHMILGASKYVKIKTNLASRVGS